MKKTLSLVLMFVLLYTMISTPQVVVTAAEPPDINEISDVNACYFEVKDRSRYQLSATELKASTDELINSVLAYPYLVDLVVGNRLDVDVYTPLAATFNGLTELETRKDSASVMLSRLENITISKTEGDSLDEVFLRMLLSVPTYSSRLSDSEKENYARLVSAYESKVNADVRTENTRSAVVFTVNGFSYVRSSSDGYTTSGELVPFYTATSDHTNSQKQSLAESTALTYGITLLGYATSMYNCHSYAWHNAVTSNVSWIEDVIIYANDDHSKSISSPSVGSIAVYLDSNNIPVHSAVVTSINGDTITCKSKWGANGLFEHHIANVPSSYYYNDTSVKCVFFNYSRYHSCTVVINNSATHTRTCTICGWTKTEPHVPNVKTGTCITCGLKGPFGYIRGNSILPEFGCEHCGE